MSGVNGLLSPPFSQLRQRVSATNELRVQPKTEAQGFEAKQVPKLGINKVSGNVVFADPIGRAQLKMLQRQSRNYCSVKELLCWRGVRSLASSLGCVAFEVKAFCCVRWSLDSVSSSHAMQVELQWAP